MIDIPAKKLNVKITQDELDRRCSIWKKPEPKVKSGVLFRYSQMVTSASTGAVFKK